MMTDSDHETSAFKSGYVTIAGAPNAGKSTLLNRILVEKIAIISSKPQTTRHRILGVCHRPGAQIVFYDTPGIFVAKDQLNVKIVDTACGAIGDADVLPVRYMVLDRVTEPAFDSAFYPSDLYYADVATADGSLEDWNAAKDGFHAAYYGEVRGVKNKSVPMNYDAIDYRPELALGRWPVSTPEEVARLRPAFAAEVTSISWTRKAPAVFAASATRVPLSQASKRKFTPSSRSHSLRPAAPAGTSNSVLYHQGTAKGLSAGIGTFEKLVPTSYDVPGNVRRFMAW